MLCSLVKVNIHDATCTYRVCTCVHVMEAGTEPGHMPESAIVCTSFTRKYMLFCYLISQGVMKVVKGHPVHMFTDFEYHTCCNCQLCTSRVKPEDVHA